jgi:AcrR family transcriptional regulator
MGTQERRRREAENRRQEILNAARKVFFESGYGGASMPRIAEEAELAPGTLYLYFPSKEALYVELLLDGYDILLERLKAAAKRPDSPAALAGRLVDVFLKFAKTHPEYYDIIFFLVHRERSGGWEGTFPAEVVNRARAKEAQCKEIVAGVLQRAGYSDPDARTDTLDAVWSMLSGVIFHFGADPAGERVVRRAKELILAELSAGLDESTV